jgi:hypothetical protein
VQQHRRLRFVNEIVEEAQRLRVGLKGRERLGLVRLGSFVRREKIDP